MLKALEPGTGSIETEGLGIAWLDWGGDGDPLVLLHPNGFCAGIYHPLALRLRDAHRVLGIDLRGHGASQLVTDPALLGNDAMARDVLAVLDHRGHGEVVRAPQGQAGRAVRDHDRRVVEAAGARRARSGGAVRLRPVGLRRPG